MTSTGDYFGFAKGMNLVTRNLDWYKVYPHGLEVEPGIAKLTTYSTKEASDMGAILSTGPASGWSTKACLTPTSVTRSPMKRTRSALS